MEIQKCLNAILNSKENTEFIHNLDEYLVQIDANLTEWLAKFEWSKETLTSKFANHPTDLFDCPFDSAHSRISRKNYAKHLEKCRLKRLDYSSADILDYFKQPNVDSLYKINLKNDLIPFKHLSRADKLELYNSAVETSKQAGYPVNSSWNEQAFLTEKDDENKSKKSIEDLREKKRRPKSYKTSKSKSYTEQIRQLIETQMSFLARDEQEKSKKEEASRNKRRSRSHDHQPHHRHKSKR